MMNCKQATTLMSEKMDRPLTLKAHMALRFHLMMCSGCSNYNDQMHDLRRITRVYAKGKDEPESGEDDETASSGQEPK